MRCPSEKNLLAHFPALTATKAKLIRTLAKLADDREALEECINTNCPATAHYASQCYHDPFNSRMWRKTMVLHAMNEIMGTYGVSTIGELRMDGPPFEYLDTGDIYNTSLVYSKKTHSLSIRSPGDIAEKL